LQEKNELNSSFFKADMNRFLLPLQMLSVAQVSDARYPRDNMLEIFLKTLPFFVIIGLGFLAGRTKFFSEEATAYLTKFVFYFALSAMLFRFSANLSLAEIFDPRFVMAYFWGTAFVYGIATAVALLRRLNIEEAAVEAQCAVIGNVGFLGIPMLVLLLGEQAIGPVMLVLAVDLIVFGSLIVILITGSRDGRMSLGILKTIGLGLIKNPMIVSIGTGFIWASFALPIPRPMNEFLEILGAAATPGALFAIGASLASKSAERLSVAGWLSFCKLVLHPAFVALAALVLFPVEPYAAGVMIAAAALPFAGNVYILAQHYGVAPTRVSASILISTAISILTVSTVIAWVSGF
jgi:predicted permease